MLYQKLLYGHDPFFVSAGRCHAYEKHYHHELELCFCTEGQCAFTVAGHNYTLQRGELAVINSMALHEYAKAPDGQRLICELGPAVLGDFFAPLVAQSAACERYQPTDALLDLLDETADAFLHRTDFSELLIRGNVYKIGALLLTHVSRHKHLEISEKVSRDIRGIEKALEIIYKRYREPLDIATVSHECGYEKSNFCKIFKRNTGETFHKLLNRHRIDVACILLAERELSVEQVAFAVGFTDVKSFCRVFKSAKGETAGNYRRHATPTTAR